jgi:hypothetical protein
VQSVGRLAAAGPGAAGLTRNARRMRGPTGSLFVNETVEKRTSTPFLGDVLGKRKE